MKKIDCSLGSISVRRVVNGVRSLELAKLFTSIRFKRFALLPSIFGRISRRIAFYFAAQYAHSTPSRTSECGRDGRNQKAKVSARTTKCSFCCATSSYIRVETYLHFIAWLDSRGLTGRKVRRYIMIILYYIEIEAIHCISANKRARLRPSIVRVTHAYELRRQIRQDTRLVIALPLYTRGKQARDTRALKFPSHRTHA